MHNKRKLSEKIVATVLLICLMLTDFAGLGFAVVSYAAENPAPQAEANSNITFAASISSDTAQRQTSYVATTTEENLILNINVGVTGTGYLKAPVLELVDLDNQMFQIKGEIATGEFIQLVDGNKIYLNQISGGTEIEINLPIEFKNPEQIDISKINSQVNLNLTGTYVDEEGNNLESTNTTSVMLGWNNDPSIQLLSNVEKYVPYKQEGIDYALVQYKVESNLVEGTESFPIKDSTISLSIPQIEGAQINSVQVSALNTALTNGLQGSEVAFTDDNWEYVDGKVNIFVANNSENTIYNTPAGKDEYVVTVIYSNVNLGDNTLLNGEVSLSTNVFAAEGVKNIAGSSVAQYDLSEQTGSIVTYEVTGQTESVSKGNVYANYNLKENFYETEYSNLLNINISRPEVVDIVEIREKDEYFTDASGNKFPTTTNAGYETYYKTTVLNKENLNSIIGENGNVQILDENNNSLVTINKDTPSDENGNIIINYNSSVGKIVVQVNNPEAEGILNVVNTKAIGKLSYGKTTAINIDRLTSEFVAAAMYDGGVKNEIGNYTTNTSLTGTKSNATVSLSRSDLSSLVKNEDVEINISLNNYNDTTDLYKNPVFELTFPKEVKEINVKTMNILYGNEELEISNIEGYKNKEGNVVLRVALKGTQTKYSLGEVTDGTTIILNSDISIDKYTTSGEKTIKMNYYNESATEYENPVEWALDVERTDDTLLTNCGEVSIPLYIVAPSGVLNVQELSNYDDSKNTLYSINQGDVSATIPTYTDGRVAKSRITMMNNSEDVMTDVSILGRTTFKGNKNITNGEDLGTTIDSSMVTGLKELSNAGKELKVYYSENPNATKDLNNEENGWKENVDSYTNIKSYLIVVNGDVQVGDIISFEYTYQIPAQLSANNVLLGTLATYYKANGVDTISESNKVTLKTVEEPVLSVETTSDAEGEVKEGQVITYTVTVKNDGKAKAEDISVTSLVAEGTTYLEEKETGELVLNPEVNEIKIDIGEIEAGTSKSVSYKVQVDDNATEEMEKPDSIEDANQKLTSTSEVEGEGLEEPIYTQSEETVVKPAEAKVTISEENYVQAVKEGQEIELDILVDTTGNINNPRITVELPKGVSYSDAYTLKFLEDGISTERVECAKYDNNSRTVTYSFDRLNGSKFVKLKVKVNKVEENGENIFFVAKVTGDGVSEYTSNEWLHTLTKPELSISYTSSTNDKYIKAGSKVEYTLVIENTGLCLAEDINISSLIPEGLNINSVTYQYNDKAQSQILIKQDKTVTKTLSIEPGCKATIRLTGKAADIDANEKQVQSSWVVTSDEMDSMTSDTITQIVQKVEKAPAKQQEEEKDKVVVNSTTSTPSTPKTQTNSTYRITGKAWNDKNENGRKDSGESGLSNVSVILYNASNNTQIQKATTDGSGEYVFSNLQNGSYYIVFGYNTSKYKLTTYHVKGSNASSNSDAVVANGLAITDKIELSGASQGDIDIGLIESKMFDLSLSKTVTKITVQNDSGTKAYDFNDSTTAKVDIRGNELASSRLYVEYKITVANKGELSGYAKSIVDHLPEGMIFSPNLNPGWYQDADGRLYTESLANTEINAGQAASIKLILVKQMTEANAEILTNTAEIAESYNESAIPDVDSVAGNGIATEDDLGSADVIVSVYTGGGMINVMVLLTTLITLFIALYVIKLRIDRNNKGVITWE